jgi:hypothetical protein
MPTNAVANLDALLEELERIIKAQASTTDIEELRAIIRRPTWKTLAEQTFFAALVQTLNDQLQSTVKIREVLLGASRQVGSRSPR